MNEQEIMLKIGKVKKVRFFSRVLIIAFLALAAILYNVGVDAKIICIGFIIACVAIVSAIGFPTQKKLNEYELQLKKLEEK